MVRRIQLFEDPNVSVERLAEFYKVERDPHTYLMFVVTMDGVAVPLEPEQHGGSEIALRHLKNHSIAVGGISDNRALQYGWATADAILGGAGILRDNPGATWYPRDKDLQELLTKRNTKPVRAVVTGSGEVDLKQPLFNPKNDEWQPIIFTTHKGERNLERQSKKMETEKSHPLQSTKTYPIGDTKVDLREAVQILRKDYNSKLLDVQGGPILAGDAIKAKAIDEIRLTISPQVLGNLNSGGKQRPGFVTRIGFGIDDSPIAELEAIGVSGSHVFLRYEVTYRH